ncbi:PQQ-dependent sugar dehydrogenase [Chitinophaga lutea]
MKTALLLFLPALLCLAACNKKSNGKPPGGEDPDWPKDSVRIVVDKGISRPWEILWGPDDFIWMTERGGRISRVNPKTGEVLPLLTLPDIVATGEGGLLGMTLHPSFAQQPFVYIVYNYGSPYREKVVRYRYENNTLASPQVLLDNIAAAGIHNGSRLLISGDKLFITTGDASAANSAQQTNLLNGKVLRLNLDGSVPADNPFAGNPVWSFGHRNPQGLVMANGILYTAEHGAGIEDEVNIIEKQRNYGWPNVEGPCNTSGENTFCAANNVREPIWSTGNGTYALSGLDYYNHDRIPQWKHSLLQVSLKNATLYQLKLSADGRSVASSKAYFGGKFGRLRDVCVSPVGRVYICTDESPGKIIEVSKPE